MVLRDFIWQQLNPDQRRAWETILLTEGQRILGYDVSVRYDLLPYLGETTIRWDQRTDQWTLRSTVRNTNPEDLLNALHNSYRAGLPAIKQTQQLLDDRFPLNMIALQTEVVTDEVTQEQEWSLRTMRPVEGSGSFISAKRDREIILSTDLTSLRAFMTAPIAPPAPRHGILAMGSLPRTLLQSDVAPLLLPAVVLEKFSQGTDASILWSLAKQQNILTWTLHD